MTKQEEWELWRRRVDRAEEACQFKGCDLRLDEYAREIGVPVNALYEWRQRIRGHTPQERRGQPVIAPPRPCAYAACGEMFQPAGPQHRYCSSRCCYAAGYERYRATHPRKMQPRAARTA